MAALTVGGSWNVLLRLAVAAIPVCETTHNKSRSVNLRCYCYGTDLTYLTPDFQTNKTPASITCTTTTYPKLSAMSSSHVSLPTSRDVEEILQHHEQLHAHKIHE